MLVFLSAILVGVMVSLRVYALSIIERQAEEEEYVFCSKCNKKIRRGNSAPYCSKCNIFC
ncbi:hypothetical protein [Bacillus sp. S10(2024)]|uniref:hypothetical protein n=1 Tax=Bacillus sp. S10(2024) TaxID=3162886 RepID=UPI003D1F696A